MSAFQCYAGIYGHQHELYRWSCYATCRIYEVRPVDDELPAPPRGRKWVAKRQHGHSGPQLAMLVDGPTTEFSHMLAQVVPGGQQAAVA
jgi:hypothetical protein